MASNSSSSPDGGKPTAAQDPVTRTFFDHASAPRVNTDCTVAKALKVRYPTLQLTIVQEFVCPLLAFASAGYAHCVPIDDGDYNSPYLSTLTWKRYQPPSRRMDGGMGFLGDDILYGKFEYRWNGAQFLLYVADGRDGVMPYPVKNYYILGPTKAMADALVLAACHWGTKISEVVMVYDGGRWTQSAELYQSVMRSSWADVILDEDMKKAIIDDHLTFFNSRESYSRLKVPWKRGVIYHGPPGNGKTISIKAMMQMLYSLKTPIPTLYVRALASWMGPEFALREIFTTARQYAPCYLVFEDLDSIVSDSVRSYFLNEVDGLKNNDGIFMIGSTNHLDRLDPGISKRPSRFDRKYLFPDPNTEQRVAYCRFWQNKLAGNKEIEFPDELCEAIADITDSFSYAYMQEAFVSALLALARKTGKDDDDSSDAEAVVEEMADGWLEVRALDGRDLDRLVLWVEIKKQIEILREGMENTA